MTKKAKIWPFARNTESVHENVLLLCAITWSRFQSLYSNIYDSIHCIQYMCDPGHLYTKQHRAGAVYIAGNLGHTSVQWCSRVTRYLSQHSQHPRQWIPFSSLLLLFGWAGSSPSWRHGVHGTYLLHRHVHHRCPGSPGPGLRNFASFAHELPGASECVCPWLVVCVTCCWQRTSQGQEPVRSSQPWSQWWWTDCYRHVHGLLETGGED